MAVAGAQLELQDDEIEQQGSFSGEESQSHENQELRAVQQVEERKVVVARHAALFVIDEADEEAENADILNQHLGAQEMSEHAESGDSD